MKPITRIDMYLAVISGDEDAVTPLPEPVTRIDHYLAYLAGENVAELPEPVTRIDSYLAKLCGMDVEIPEEPITRIDFYLAVLNGETVDLPDAVTRIDYYLDAWAQGGGDLPWQTFTGNPLQFNAPKAHTLRSVKVEFSPIQSGSGDPSPDNVRPITGWTGANINRTGENLFDKANVTDLNGYFGSGAIASSVAHKTIYIPCKPNTTYTVSNSANNRKALGYTKEVPDTGIMVYGQATGTITTGNDAKYLVCYCFNGNSDTVTYQQVLDAFQIVLGATAPSDYSPYTGETLSLTWTSQGTVYGGYAEVAEDGSVTLTADRAIVSLSAFDFTGYSTPANHVFRATFTDVVPDIVEHSNGNIGYGDISDSFTYKPYSPIGASDNGKFAISNSGTNRIVIIDHRYSSVADFEDSVKDVQICYKLKNPVVTHLSSVTQLQALVGINTMWSDTNGELTVEARAEAVNLSALQSLNMLLGGRYYNNGGANEPSDEEALDILMGGER